MSRIIYTLAGMVSKQKINLSMIEYAIKFPNHLKDPVNFIVYGSPGFCAWKGSHNDSIYLSLPTWNELNRISDQYRSLGCNIRLDFSNLILNQENFCYDNYGYNLARLLDDGSNQICISNSYMYDFIQKHFPNYTPIASEFNLDIDERNYFYIVRNNHNLKMITDKNKTEIILHSPCNKCDTNKWSHCIMSNQVNIINFSKNMCTLSECQNLSTNIHMNNDKDIEYYKEVGYTAFQAFEYLHDLIQLDIYIEDLIKEEYKKQAKNYILLNLNEGVLL